MIEGAALVHACIAGGMVTIPACTVAWGQQRASCVLTEMIDQQPAAAASLFRAFIFGTALNEAAAIIGSLVGIMILVSSLPVTWYRVIAELGMGCAVILPAGYAGILGARPQCTSIRSIALQPLMAQKITQLMFFTLTMMQMGALLGLIIAFLVQGRIPYIENIYDAIQLGACGLTFGLGSLGPLYGMSCFTRSVGENVGKHQQAYAPLFSFAFISPALIETPILFSLGISLFMITFSIDNGVAYIAAALAMGLSTIGPGIASGRIAAAACDGIGLAPERAGSFTSVSLLSQTIVDASAIYGLVIAALILIMH